jgi:serine/threonine-protein kinase RsbW
MRYLLSIAYDKQHLASVRTFVREVLLTYKISEIQIYQLVLAIDEICANLIIHSQNCNEHRSFELEIEVIPDRQILFLLRDDGDAFDITKYCTPELEEIITAGRKGGMGLILVKRIMDNIEFSKEKNHNICRLVKNITN